MTVFAVAIAAGDIIKYQPFVYGSFVWAIHVRYNNEEYKQDKAICVVETFHAYVEKTKMLRGDYSQLFIGLQKPHTPVTKSTLARWIKAVLVSSGIDMSMYTPHSTRSASTSVAALKIPIHSVLKTAGWKKDCVFRKFYQREVTNNSEFSNAVLGQLQ